METGRAARRAPEWQIWTALLIVYIVWGSTYLAISVVDQTMPPLLAAGVRHLSAGVILFALVILRFGRSALNISRREFLGGAFVGLALLLGGNGLVVLAETSVPSGLTALIIAIVPLFVVILRRIYGERVYSGTYLGVAIGFAGVAVLIIPRGISGQVDLGGMLLLLGASLSWAIGSYFSHSLPLPKDPLASTGTQMLVGGGTLLVAGLLLGESSAVKFDSFSTASVAALVYLILFGSVLAYTAYTWLLQNANVSRVATYAYVNPLVAIVLGGLLLNEKIDVFILIGAAMIVASVILVIRTEQKRAPSSTPTETPTDSVGAPPATSEELIAG